MSRFALVACHTANPKRARIRGKHTAGTVRHGCCRVMLSERRRARRLTPSPECPVKDSAKYRTLYNWYVQLTPGAILQPVESASEMLRRYVHLRETFPQAECGLMRAEIIRATGKMSHLEVWPLTTAGTVEIRATDRTDDTDALTDELARARAVWKHAGTPITQGFTCA